MEILESYTLSGEPFYTEGVDIGVLKTISV